MTKGCPTIHFVWIVPPSDEAAVDTWVASHEAFMQETHSFGAGPEPCMLKYYIAKGKELNNPMNPESGETGNFIYTMSEVYKTAAGIPAHMELAQPRDDGKLFGTLMEINGKYGKWLDAGTASVFTNIADSETTSITAKSQPTIHCVQKVPKADEQNMDAYWKSHEEFMRATHVCSVDDSIKDEDTPRVTSFSINKGVVLNDPLDPESGDSGFVSYTMSETYAAPSGIAGHFVKAPEHWPGFAELPEINEKYLLTIEIGSAVVANMGDKMK